MQARGKRLTLTIAPLALVVLGLATWQAWPQIVFRWRFEALGPNAEGYQEYRHRQTGIIFVRLPGGTFWMGAQKDDPEGHNYDPNAEPWEGPVHEVTLSPFLIAKFELTQGEWHAVMGNYRSYFDGTKDYDGNPVKPWDNRDRLPFESVSWNQIRDFGERTGLTLPTEAQWEFACRGDTDTAFSFGSGDSLLFWRCAPCPKRGAHMWYCANSENRTHEVGTKLPNSFGLHDMHGNVSEWVEDEYREDFYSTPEAAGPDPLCTSGSEEGVIRGGCWDDLAGRCRSALRGRFHHPVLMIYPLGFRAAYWPLP